jgi:hypothetical protein
MIRRTGETDAARLAVGAATALILMTATTAAWADKGKAHMLRKQADHAYSQSRCHLSSGCEDRAVFPKVVADYEKAFRLDPSPEMALAFCQLHRKSNGPDAKAFEDRGGARSALARCDYALLHPDSDEQTRRRALSDGRDIRSSLAIDRGSAADDARKVAAARALYGEGLTMKYDKRSNKITFDYGKLDAATLQEYIGEYYIPAMLEVGINEFSSLHQDRLGEWGAARQANAFGWTLLEPMAKFQICEKLVTHLHIDWCRLQSLIEANAPLFAFRGQAVEWDATRTSGGGVTGADRIFLPTVEGRYDVAITIASPITLDGYHNLRLMRAIRGNFYNQQGDSYREAMGVFAKAEKASEAKKKAYEAQERKLAGTRGNVVFAEAPFVGWEVPPLLRKGATADCSKLHYRSWNPRGSGVYELDYKVDGTLCNREVSGMTDSLARPRNHTHGDRCPDALMVPGEHTVTIEMHQNKAGKTGNRVITRDGVIRDETVAYRARRVGTWTAKCTTTGSGPASRFE